MRISPRAIGPAHGVRSAHRPFRTAVHGHRRRVAMTALSDAVKADQALKAKHRAMWALGDYPSVARALENAQVIIKTLAFKKGINLDVDVAAAPPDLFADEAKFKQIMYNLLSNAVKFTPDKGRVTVTATRRSHSNGNGAPASKSPLAGECLEVTVAD